MIEVKNVKKKFKKKINKKETIEFFANNDISLTASDGEIVGILGPNGAGKTTLLRIIVGILEPTSGSVLYDDKTFKKNEIEIKKSVAFLSGNTKIYNLFTTYELLKMCGKMYDLDNKIIESRIKEISEKLNLTDFLYSRIGNLSTGQIQRVNIARCLIHNPKYYILDEATTGLDILSSQIILDFIKEEKKNGKIVLYSTHYMEEAENICDRVILINKGKVIESGTPKDILRRTNTLNLRDAFFKIIGGVNNE